MGKLIYKIIEKIVVGIICFGWLPSMIAWYYLYGSIALRDILSLSLNTIALGIVNIVWMSIGVPLYLMYLKYFREK